MDTLIERLSAMKDQIARSVDEHLQLRQRLQEQEKQALEKGRMCDVLKERVNELERENEALRKAESTAREASVKPGTKEKIDELVAEIDRCLELLQN